MLRNTTRSILLLAALCLVAPGQNTEPEKPKPQEEPVIIESNISNPVFVDGQNIAIQHSILVRNGVVLNLEGLKNGGEFFKIQEFSQTKPIPSQEEGKKNYNQISVLTLFYSDTSLVYGEYKFSDLNLSYEYDKIEFTKDEDGTDLIYSHRVTEKQTLKPLTAKKQPLTSSSSIDRDVVYISEVIKYSLTIYHDKKTEVLNSGSTEVLSRYNLDPKEIAKFQLGNLDRPNLSNLFLFQTEKIEHDRGRFKEIEYVYFIQLHEVDLTKIYEISPINILFAYRHMEIDVLSISSTPKLKIRTNSILMPDSGFRGLKPQINVNQREYEVFGQLTIKLSKIIAISASTILLVCTVISAWRLCLRVRKTGPGIYLSQILMNMKRRINQSRILSHLRLDSTLKEFQYRPDQINLRKLITAMRSHISSMIGIDQTMSLALSTQEFRSLLSRKGCQPGTVIPIEFAENLLDDGITQSDIGRVIVMIGDMKKTFGIWQYLRIRR